MDSMKQVLVLPDFKEQDLNIHARLIYWISASMIIGSLVFLLAVRLFSSHILGRALVLTVVLIPVCVAIIILVRRSQLRLAGMLLISMTWLVVTLGSVTAGGITAPIFMGYLIVIILGGLLRNQASFYVDSDLHSLEHLHCLCTNAATVPYNTRLLSF